MHLSVSRTVYTVVYGISICSLLFILIQPSDAQESSTFNTSLVERSPVGTSGQSQGRRFPSRDKISKALIGGKPPRDRALFWSGLPEDSNQRHRIIGLVAWYASRYGLNLISDHRNWEPRNFFSSTEKQYVGTEYQRWKFWEQCNQVYSARTAGTAYLLMPYGTSPPEHQLFWDSNWPNLKTQGLVTKIVWLDAELLWTQSLPPPDDPSHEIWWKPGDIEPATVPGSAPEANMIQKGVPFLGAETVAWRRPRLTPTPTPTPTPSSKSKPRTRPRHRNKKTSKTPAMVAITPVATPYARRTGFSLSISPVATTDLSSSATPVATPSTGMPTGSLLQAARLKY